MSTPLCCVDTARLAAIHGLRQFVGRSVRLHRQLEQLPRIARSDATVLILGETGTGKELTARAIHYLSPRSARAFVPVNCGALPAELVENELFGHVVGAYTGATQASEGLVSEADGGTLFLDEVDSLSLASQVKLLRFLQEKEIRPVGARRLRKVNARVVAAANSDLRENLRAGRLRADLFYRLSIVPLRLPPLRERREDIRELTDHFVQLYASQLGVAVPEVSAAAHQKLLAHDWPGNIRELQNVLERAVLLAETQRLEPADLVLDHGTGTGTGTEAASFKALKAQAVAAFERSFIVNLLRTHDGNITQAARAAGKHRRALWELMRKHGLTHTARGATPAGAG